ncbi:hypothetical protein FisN_20Hh102 [Fistulifera solaris]|uniref:NB-ARC domain-containing protein n=1 Tax=Fistulifera solaris TaxID=1519565 RepID=A0A1Z5KCG9_FISSO|nr:hypothetical protein FisN_20Hh102 [Fistulifera solaris]|eukprot:GAX23896.1 hypothetical protein FisN_20Hh102 [Fistulifera solaris]
MSEDEYDGIFGFGSIINSSTHAAWLENVNASSFAGRMARIHGQYQRAWNFRSATGFTALGILKSDESVHVMNGVLFKIPDSVIADFDRREVGYDRIEIPQDCIELLAPECHENPQLVHEFGGMPKKVWIYVPQEGQDADENHPLLQSYVDTVMQGCLEWGGQPMAREFVATTVQWSPYFLNDTPSSRRPWLFRKEYDTIDKILRETPSTHFTERKHPEEFASAFLSNMRGIWSVPRRNTTFTGRDGVLLQMHQTLTTQSKIEVVGMGGVGKSQLCTEYCYRYYPSYYGLAIWLNAESAETLAANYRQLMADTTDVDVKDKDADEVVTEVKARLYRLKVPWLLVFDNLEDHSLLEKFVPRGGASGHVLVTSRWVESVSSVTTLSLDCFDSAESVEFLCRSAGERNVQGKDNLKAARALADRLGHLPLALGMAAAYMQRCDVACSEYLNRYRQSGTLLAHRASKLVDYPLGVASSLSLSLNVIQRENNEAFELLHLLGWLGPDQITKALMRSLLTAKSERKSKDKEMAMAASVRKQRLQKACICFSLTTLLVVSAARLSKQRLRNAGFVSAICVVSTVFHLSKSSSEVPVRTRKPSFTSFVYEETDEIWNILKSFSIITVKHGKGSMHRLLAQALRHAQSEDLACRNLEICLRAVLMGWTFKPEKTETWQASLAILEHAKSVTMHSFEHKTSMLVETAMLSKEIGILATMVLNRFVEAESALELSLKILCQAERITHIHRKVQAESLYELGRVLRYQGNFEKSEEKLRESLMIRKSLSRHDPTIHQAIAETLHEIGMNEVKRHYLDSAASFFQQALDLKQVMDAEYSLMHRDQLDASYAKTLHQLAAVYVARKPPSLAKAETLLQEALSHSTQIGQRAATLKELARVTMRQGLLNRAELYLAQALELYEELYGENASHINVAAVKFQQGALESQRDRLDEAWVCFSDCLRIRRQVYAYARTQSDNSDDNPVHLDVSSVLHELGHVAFNQHNLKSALEMLKAERSVLERLFEITPTERISQARLTNLTWLKKCYQAIGDEEAVLQIATERKGLKLKKKGTEKESKHHGSDKNLEKRTLLQVESLRCRLVVRQFALTSDTERAAFHSDVQTVLAELDIAIRNSESNSMRSGAEIFHNTVTKALASKQMFPKGVLLQACDDLRDVLRDQGIQVNDMMQKAL